MMMALAAPALAEPLPWQCSKFEDATQRLACYDSTVQVVSYGENPAQAYLNRTWELGDEYKTGLFNFRAYQPNSVLLWRHSTNPNQQPHTPTQRVVTPKNLQANELRYHLSVKTKLWENIFQSPLDLWFAYTQQSSWQIYNTNISSPFRETNYEPEIILTIPMHNASLDDFLGLRLKMINIGLSHQSNGQSTPLSRSWNRLYVSTGLEKSRFLLTVRAWQRIRENASNDDNPDIGKFMGSGDVRATWFGDKSAVTLLSRYNLASGKGAMQLNWIFPLSGHLKGYAEFFSGYGETLADYNQYQNLAGIGLLISTWP